MWGIKYLHAQFTLPLCGAIGQSAFIVFSLLCTRSIQHAFHLEEE